MILVTGASGKTGQAIIRALIARRQIVRALIHRSDQAASIKRLGAQEAVVGDLRDAATIEQAAHGARVIYHICPNVFPEETVIGQNVIRAAQSAKVERFVYHSVLHPQVEALPHHWQKLRVEEQLFESGLTYTLLQPASYMQNVLAYWDQIVKQGVYPVPYAATARLSMVDLNDVAEAAARVLIESDHVGAIYELCGPEALSPSDIVEILAQQLEQPVRVEAVALDQWEQQARSSGLGEYQRETLLQMFRYYDRYGLWGNPNVLSWLLGRAATTFAQFVERTVRERGQG